MTQATADYNAVDGAFDEMDDDEGADVQFAIHTLADLFLRSMLRRLPNAMRTHIFASKDNGRPAADAAPDSKESLTRSLLAAQSRLDKVCRYAIRVYLEAEADVAHAQRLLDYVNKLSDGSAIHLAQDNLVRMKRHRQDRAQWLGDLAIRKQVVSVGDPFDPAVHQQVGTMSATRPEQVGTVAAVEQPLFTWLDEFGQPQCEHAQVICFIAG